MEIIREQCSCWNQHRRTKCLPYIFSLDLILEECFRPTLPHVQVLLLLNYYMLTTRRMGSVTTSWCILIIFIPFPSLGPGPLLLMSFFFLSSPSPFYLLVPLCVWHESWFHEHGWRISYNCEQLTRGYTSEENREPHYYYYFFLKVCVVLIQVCYSSL